MAIYSLSGFRSSPVAWPGSIIFFWHAGSSRAVRSGACQSLEQPVERRRTEGIGRECLAIKLGACGVSVYDPAERAGIGVLAELDGIAGI